jgi:hypothetical protein
MLHKKKSSFVRKHDSCDILFSCERKRPVPSDENHCFILNLTAYKARVPTQKKISWSPKHNGGWPLPDIVTLLSLLRTASLIALVSDFVQDSVSHSLGEGSRFLHNIGTYIPNYTASHSRRLLPRSLHTFHRPSWLKWKALCRWNARLLGCDTAWSCRNWSMFKSNVLPPYWK